MYIPVLSSYASTSGEVLDNLLRKRSPVPEPKGGGGHGSGHASSGHSSGTGSEGSTGSTGSSGSSSSHGSSESSGSSSAPFGSRGSTIPVTGSASSRSSATLYGSGDSKVSTIPQGQPFAGRSVGGGTRDGVYGSPYYGSGYPASYGGSGVVGGGFPYYYYPVVWPSHGYGPTYLHTSSQYGKPDNSSRPGGPEMQAAFTSRSSSSTTFHVVADNSTVVALIATINSSCNNLLNANSSKTPIAINGSANEPLPEQTIQYYRASTVALTLDGYNNTAALVGDANAKPVPLPTNVDTALLNCLNSTIGQSVPLFDAASGAFSISAPGFLSLMAVPYAIWCLMDLF